MSDYDEDEVITMIDDCVNREENLNDWERGFISSIGDQADKHIMLSRPQIENLNKIWRRIT